MCIKHSVNTVLTRQIMKKTCHYHLFYITISCCTTLIWFYLGLIQFNNSTKAKANKLIDKLYLFKRIIHKTTDGNYATVKYSKRHSFTHLQILNLWSNISEICKYPFLPLFILKLNAFLKTTTLRDNKKELLRNYPKPIMEHNFQLLSLL